MPASDITGLSRPSPGFKLVGIRVRVCNDHGGATGAFDWSLDSSDGGGRLKFPQRNYGDSLESMRKGCDAGWVVFEIPQASDAEKVRYEFDHTGQARHEQSRVSARFSWTV